MCPSGEIMWGAGIMREISSAGVASGLTRRVWISASLYAVVPALYVATAVLAFRSLWLIPGWSLIHSFFCVLGFGCGYAGGAVLALRWQGWKCQRADASASISHA
jgi:hypothetical protein